MRQRQQGNKTAICGHFGCTKTLREGSWNWPTGFCLQHQPVAPPAPPREGVRVAVVYLVPHCSSSASAHLVSLPREPWVPA